MRYKVLIFFCLVSVSGADVLAEKPEINIYTGDVESRFNALTSIQPGLGVIMHEIGYRISAIYWAANGGNWGLAQYELKELLEAQEVAEITRPQRAKRLRAFEKRNLLPLGEAIMKKDIKMFNQRFSTVVNACNDCHTASGYDFIKYHVPTQSQYEVLDYNLKTEPKYEEEEEQK